MKLSFWAALVLIPASFLSAQTCGQVVTSNITLTADLGPCSGDGLRVENSNVTINLNGRRIFATAGSTGTGVRIVNGQDITVRSGRLEGFANGVTAVLGPGGSPRLLVRNVTFTRGGVSISQSLDARILDCTFTGVSGTGTAIGVVESLRPKIRGNRISAYATGIFISNSTSATVIQNTVTSNGEGLVLAPGPAGISVNVLDNTLSGNVTLGIRGSTNFGGPLTIQGNLLNGNGAGGIKITGSVASLDSRLEDNRVTNNSGPGIEILGDRVKVIDNVLSANFTDLLWDGIGANSCWKFNFFTASVPAVLPVCP